MKLGFIGLGRMGSRMVLNLLDQQHTIVVHNRSIAKMTPVVRKGALPAYSLAELVAQLPKPRVIWLMVAAGKPVDLVINGMLPYLSKGDVIIEGGNSYYRDSVRRYRFLKKRGIRFLDCGTSGGLSGARHGACLTIGGDRSVFKQHEKLFRDLAAKGGYGYLGPAGAGHYVKVLHNGIEYALLQAYAEGYEVLHRSPYKHLDLSHISSIWSHGSIIRSYLSELAVGVFRKHPRMAGIPGAIGGGETGKWTQHMAKDAKAQFGVLDYALRQRAASQKTPRFSSKVVAALRNAFGGHSFVQAKK